MAEITWELPSGQLQSIQFDAVVRDSHESSAEATEHPVETGANIADHVRAGLDTVTLEAVVSNTPIRPPTTQTSGISGRQSGIEIRDSLTGLVLAKANVLVFDGPLDRVRTVYEELLRLEKAGTVVGIITSLREYESMILTRVSPVREAQSGGALIVTVEAREIRIVDSEIVEAPEPEETRAGSRRNRGRQNPTETAADTDTRNRSYIIQMRDAAQSFFGSAPASP